MVMGDGVPMADGDWEGLCHALDLGPREAGVVLGVLAEHKDTVIAAQLGMTVNTVRKHMRRLCRKLHCHTKVGIAVAVWRCEKELRGKAH